MVFYSIAQKSNSPFYFEIQKKSEKSSSFLEKTVWRVSICISKELGMWQRRATTRKQNFFCWQFSTFFILLFGRWSFMIFCFVLNRHDEWKVFYLFFESNRYFSNEMTQTFMFIHIFVFCLFVHSGKWKGFFDSWRVKQVVILSFSDRYYH